MIQTSTMMPTHHCTAYEYYWATSGHPWLTPVSLTTQEAEIRKIQIGSQPGQVVPRDPILKKTHHKKGLVKWFKV
jgi:hypothetical protein